MTPAVIELDSLSVYYPTLKALDKLSISISPGQIVGIIGPNGAGKSTLIKALLGLVPYSGTLKIFGQAAKTQRTQLGYVPQKDSIDWDFPVNVYDVVMMGRYGSLSPLRRPSERDHAIVNQALQDVELSDLKERHISALSGGQQQRVFLARALAQQSEIYLMDEPFTGVDAATEQAIIKVLHRLKNAGKTILIVHHDLMSVQEYFDSVALINQQLISYGPTQTHFTLEKLQKTFGGKLNLFGQQSILPSEEA